MYLLTKKTAVIFRTFWVNLLKEMESEEAKKVVQNIIKSVDLQIGVNKVRKKK